MKVIKDFLSGAEVEAMRALAAEATFEDGSSTAGVAIREEKQNRQAVLSEQQRRLVDDTLRGAARRSKLFGLYAHPRNIATPILSRYEEGDFYNRHLDQALMGIDDPFRADLSMTIFLSDPMSYTGGELRVEMESGHATLRLQPGTAAIYPTSFWHQVTRITKGERLALVTWVQSYVADPGKRALLTELGEAFDMIMRMNPADPLHGQTREKVQRSYTNLLRLWSEV